MVLLLSSGVSADTIDGFAYLDGSSSHGNITVKLFLSDPCIPPNPIPVMTISAMMLLMIIMTFFLCKRRTMICVVICVFGMISTIVVYALTDEWVYTTSMNGYYSFMTEYESAQYRISFTRDDYRPAFFGPFQTGEKADYAVPDTTLFRWSNPIPTRTPLATPTCPNSTTPTPKNQEDRINEHPQVY